MDYVYIGGVRKWVWPAECEATAKSKFGTIRCAEFHFTHMGRDWHVARPAVIRKTCFWPDELSDGGPKINTQGNE